MNEGKKEERGLRMKGDKRWNIYHVLPPILILLFVIINDVMICLILIDDYTKYLRCSLK